jgi:hypothetical protein
MGACPRGPVIAQRAGTHRSGVAGQLLRPRRRLAAAWGGGGVGLRGRWQGRGRSPLNNVTGGVRQASEGGGGGHRMRLCVPRQSWEGPGPIWGLEGVLCGRKPGGCLGARPARRRGGDGGGWQVRVSSSSLGALGGGGGVKTIVPGGAACSSGAAARGNNMNGGGVVASRCQGARAVGHIHHPTRRRASKTGRLKLAKTGRLKLAKGKHPRRLGSTGPTGSEAGHAGSGHAGPGHAGAENGCRRLL